MFGHALSTYCSGTIDFAPPPSMALFRAGEEACSKRNPIVVGGRHGRGSDGLWGVCCGCQNLRGFIAGEAHKMSKYGESARATFTSRSSVGRTGGVHSLGLDDGLGLGLDQARSIIMHHHDSSC
ncbi:BQ5605_C003g02163 [Microbotryum silenes-dioicae]|uniref:BQ5605_C003g02163 protein n=1 Tax=Microbotryum silenes-dioicae TaxID=796604 RepID=A0A2X0M4V9_9BASI|nr:BQ5605_C003g02163 [Microbotryum silenes-dioicae]